MFIAYTDRPITVLPIHFFEGQLAAAPLVYLNGELIEIDDAGHAVLNDASGIRQSMQIDGHFDPRDHDARGPYEVCYVDADKLVFTPDPTHTYVVHFVRRAA